MVFVQMKEVNPMKRFFAALALAVLLSGCAQPAPASSAASPQAQPAKEWSVFPLGPASALTEQGFYSTDVIVEDGASVLTFYDFDQMAQRVVCDVPDCSHDSDACPAWKAGSHLFLLGDTLLSLGGPTDDDYDYIYLRRYDTDGHLVGTRTVLAGWELAGTFTDGQFLYGCIDGDLLYLDPDSGLETVIRRKFLPSSYSPIGTIENQIMWNGTDPEQPTQQVLYRMEDDFSLTEFFRYDPSEVNLLCIDHDHLYWADMATGEIKSTDADGQTQTLSTALSQYIFTRPEDGWCSVQSWSGQVLGEKLLVDVLIEQTDLASTCFAINFSTGEATICTLTDYWNGYAHPVAIWAETDRGLLVSQHEPVMRTTMGQDGCFATFESSRTLYGFIDAEDFFAGRPEYRMISSISI